MSADAASLPCPICSHTGVFESVKSLRDRLIAVSTNKILCPVCQEEICGLDKLTIHLFSHVKLIPSKNHTEKCEPKSNDVSTCKPKSDSECVKTQPKKPRSTSASKNKPTPPSSSASAPVKFVKIYPKLPVISLNTVPVINVSGGHPECTQTGNSIYVPTVQVEAPITQTNTCNICGLQFVNGNILNMHKCLIHNFKDDSNQTFTRYDCHLCSKNFKMRGSLMVHLRVAHYGFASSTNNNSTTNKTSACENKNMDQLSEDKLANFERNDNKQWQCDVCQKCFTTKYFLKKHKRLHTGETPYACLQCNKTFTFQQSYHKHLLYHNDEKPHTCNYCGRAFKELSTLHNHQRIHTGEKPFSCETCGKCFRQRVSYLVHRRIHTGVMPYKCTACDKSFRYKVSQRTHKCQAQPPGTVIRQAGDLLEKLKKKHPTTKSTSDVSEVTEARVNINTEIREISKENVELAMRGAKISLEDMESECFSLITEAFSENNNGRPSTTNTRGETLGTSDLAIENHIFNSNIEHFIESIPIDDKNAPSPSDILKNLCLSKDTRGETLGTSDLATENHIFDSNIEHFIESIPIDDKNAPSPSDILKNLCLSKEDDYLDILQ